MSKYFAGLAFLASVVVLPQPLHASPITTNFTIGAAGSLNTSTFVDSVTGLSIKGYYSTNNGSTWSAANLFRRDGGAGDRGMGLCGPGETTANCTSSTEFSGIDNFGNADIVRLKLPDNYRWVAITLSAFDTNGGSPIERAKIYADADGVAGTVGHIGSTVLGNATVAQAAGSATDTEPTINVTTPFQSAKYIFLEAYDWGGGGNKNNDFLVHSVTLEHMPEPATMILVGTGLATLTVRHRRRRAAAARGN